jgi:hypothetical protein
MIARAFAFAAAFFMATGSVAFALDQSTRDVGPRSPVELCCVDTGLLPPIETSIAPDRHALLDLNRTAPKSDAKPGLDGADWNCRRPDGSRRCFSSLRHQ